MAKVPYEMWAGYYQLLLAQAESKPQTLLDVCCGTGKVAQLLTQDGYRITGIDSSSAMIAEAKKRTGNNLEFILADATDFDLGRTFDGAFSFFDSLNYITTVDGLRSAIHCVGKHLQPGATFIFDVNTEYAFTEKMFDQEDRRKRAEIKYSWLGDYNPTTRIIEVDMNFWVGDDEIHEVHVQRAHTSEEIIDALKDGGFNYVRSFDSYTLEPPDNKSDRIHYLTVKGP